MSPHVEQAAASTRQEAALRELTRAKLRALDAYNAHVRATPVDLTEEQRIDLEIEGARLWSAFIEACRCLVKYNSEHAEAA